MTSCRRQIKAKKEKLTLRSLVDEHIKIVRPRAKRELRFYSIQQPLADAVEKATLSLLPSGIIHSHQRRVGRKALAQAHEALRHLKFQRIKTFDELYSLIYNSIHNIPRIGFLTIYDITHRIGAFLGIMPDKVYLHADTLAGAQVLGLDCSSKVLELAQIPKELRRLEPYEVEDFLCIFKDRIKKTIQQPLTRVTVSRAGDGCRYSLK